MAQMLVDDDCMSQLSCVDVTGRPASSFSWLLTITIERIQADDSSHFNHSSVFLLLMFFNIFIIYLMLLSNVFNFFF